MGPRGRGGGTHHPYNLNIKMCYKCKYCGKEFEKLQSLGGHTTFCKQNPDHDKHIQMSSNHISEHNRFRKDNKDYGYCKQCGSLLNKPGRKFCSSSCAAKYNNKKRIESNVSTKGKTKTVQCLKCGSKIEVSIHSSKTTWICDHCRNIHYQKKLINRRTRYLKKCIICGKEYWAYTSTSCHCSSKCSCQDPLVKQKLKDAQNKLIDKGTHVGWQSRNIRSYPENFWKQVLDKNDINYQQEFYIKQYRYFLDFLITKNNSLIDLEIDGKQHLRNKDKDIIRDNILSSMGYIVYRIPWNEINSDSGKLEMKQKINDFLKFLSQIE